MSKRDNALYLSDIKTAIKKIEQYTRELTYLDFEHDNKTIDAVIRNLAVIGEAVNNLAPEFRAKNKHVPWQKIISMRNKVLHEYFGVDCGILCRPSRKISRLLKKSSIK